MSDVFNLCHPYSTAAVTVTRKAGEPLAVMADLQCPMRVDVPLVEGCANRTVTIDATRSTGRLGRWQCKLDPSLKATCFQPLNLRVHTVLST